jgi:radical SAM superfamily enzyme YgiQ (UPF0313 family)
MSALDRWRGISSSPNVVLIEGPGLQLAIDGCPLNPLLLRYPKYPQLLLASNIATRLEGVAPTIVDLKGEAGSENDVAARHLRSMTYEKRRLDFYRVGLPESKLDALTTDAELIGISCNFSMERTIVIDLISRLRKRLPKTLIVAGGHDATVAPTPYLNAGANICVSGEGETAIGDILSTRCEDDLKKLRGLSFMTDNGLKRNGKRPIHLLDSIRYPSAEMLAAHVYDEYPDGPWPPGIGPMFAVLETSRGCDEACNFCSSTFVSGRFRAWSVDGILHQLETTKQAGIGTLLIADDNLLYRLLGRYGGANGRDDLIRLFTTMREEGFAWTFYNGIQFGLLEREGIIDEALIAALFGNGYRNGKLSGCFEVYLPLERFAPEDIRQLPKLREHAVQKRIMGSIAAQGVHRCNLGFIVGTPSDSHESISVARDCAWEFAEFIQKESTARTAVRHLPWCSVPLPGTPNRSNYKGGIRYDLDVWPELHNNYISAIEGIDMGPMSFTLARKDLDEQLNNRRSILPEHRIVTQSASAPVGELC